jgi:NADPH2:quinone reductase
VRAAVIRDGQLRVEERELPVVTGDRVLVEVISSGVNRADLLQLRGAHPAPPGWPPDIPGLEFSGVVAAIGDGVVSVAKGDEVFGIVGGGAHATHLVTPESLCVPRPEGLDPVEAGGVAEVFMTAYDALVTRGRVASGERVLVHGAGSGVGTAAVQIARALGARTVGTARTADKLERAQELGLDDAVVAGEDMSRQIGDVDVVIELVGGRYLETDVVVCRPGGRIVVVGLLAGSSVDLDLGALMRKRLTLVGTVLRSRPEWEKAELTARFSKHVAPLFGSGMLRPVVDRIVELDRISDAYDALGSNRTFGKIVLTMEGRS